MEKSGCNITNNSIIIFSNIFVFNIPKSIDRLIQTTKLLILLQII